MREAGPMRARQPPRRERARAPMRRRNRRRPNLVRLALRLSLFVLFVECIAAVLFSPRLWVRKVAVEGNHTLSARRIFERLRLDPRANIVRLPIGRLGEAVEKEPAIARATLHCRLPGTLIVKVRERTPWAVVKTGGVCYTVDQTLVPFRKGRTPEPGLPLVTLEAAGGKAPRLGKQIVAPGAGDVNKCLQWAARSRFPLEKIRVDQRGKLCLNREGGAEVRLGSGMDLDKKLNALMLLLSRRADLREGRFDYIILYAYDAPAILPRSGSSASFADPRRGRSDAESAQGH